MMTLKQYVGPDVAIVWPVVEGLLQKAVDYAHGDITTEDLRLACIREEMQLFIFWDGETAKSSLVTEFLQYPRKKVIRVIAAAGKGYGQCVREYWDLLSVWAGQNGVSEFESWNRPSMTRYLRRLGFEKVYEVTRLRLKGS
jgi:hypothetical protein